ncbi:unnamed protein product, partial [Prorocentrum cordatum]
GFGGLLWAGLASGAAQCRPAALRAPARAAMAALVERCCAALSRWRAQAARSNSSDLIELASAREPRLVGGCRASLVGAAPPLPQPLREPTEAQLRDGAWRRSRAARWMEVCGAAVLKRSSRASFRDYAALEPGGRELYKEAIETIERDVPRTLPGSFRFRLWRDLLGELRTSGGYEEALRDILVALVRRLQTGMRGGQRGYTQGMSNIAAALLVFAGDAEDAFWLLVALVERVAPPDFYAEPPGALNGALVEAGVVSFLLEHTGAGRFSADERASVSQILTVKMGVPFLVDCVPPALTIAIWDHIQGWT